MWNTGSHCCRIGLQLTSDKVAAKDQINTECTVGCDCGSWALVNEFIKYTTKPYLNSVREVWIQSPQDAQGILDPCTFSPKDQVDILMWNCLWDKFHLCSLCLHHFIPPLYINLLCLFSQSHDLFSNYYSYRMITAGLFLLDVAGKLFVKSHIA